MRISTCWQRTCVTISASTASILLSVSATLLVVQQCLIGQVIHQDVLTTPPSNLHAKQYQGSNPPLLSQQQPSLPTPLIQNIERHPLTRLLPMICLIKDVCNHLRPCPSSCESMTTSCNLNWLCIKTQASIWNL